MNQSVDDQLRALLIQAQALGFIGGDDIDSHIRHAQGFGRPALMPTPPGTALDLGAGGGLPGLVLAAMWPETQWWLVDASERRTRFLTDAVAQLQWSSRVWVRRGRAEELARSPELRAHFDLVTARSFGPPAVTAECAAGFLRAGGRLLVSEPPRASVTVDATGDDGSVGPAIAAATTRWPSEGLDRLNLEAEEAPEAPPGQAGYQVLRQRDVCPEQYPRRVGIPAKRPLFR